MRIVVGFLVLICLSTTPREPHKLLEKLFLLCDVHTPTSLQQQDFKVVLWVFCLFFFFFPPQSTKQPVKFINVSVDSKGFDRKGSSKANNLPTHWGPSSQGLSHRNLITGNSFLNCLLLSAHGLTRAVGQWVRGREGYCQVKATLTFFLNFQIISYLANTSVNPT